MFQIVNSDFLCGLKLSVLFYLVQSFVFAIPEAFFSSLKIFWLPFRNKVPDNGDWSAASNYVAKRYISPVNNSVYLDDVRLQMEAKLWAEAFNKQNPPKKVICLFSL